jgi:hypothetical protein
MSLVLQILKFGARVGSAAAESVAYKGLMEESAAEARSRSRFETRAGKTQVAPPTNPFLAAPKAPVEKKSKKPCKPCDEARRQAMGLK